MNKLVSVVLLLSLMLSACWQGDWQETVYLPDLYLGSTNVTSNLTSLSSNASGQATQIDTLTTNATLQEQLIGTVNASIPRAWWSVSLLNWASSSNGSGSMANAALFNTFTSGNTAQSVGLGFVRFQGYNLGAGVDNHNWTKDFEFEFKVSSYDVGVNTKAFRIQQNSGLPTFNVTAENLTAAGVGIQIVGHTLYAESYGTSYNFTSLNYTFGNYVGIGVKIVKRATYIAYYLNQGAGYVLALNMTDTNAIPSGAVATFGVAWCRNYSSTMSGTIRVYEPRYWQEE